MTTYNTGNPVGSTDPRDLYDNAENLDELVNSDSKQSLPDRLGKSRKSWQGMEDEFDASQAYRSDAFQSSQDDHADAFQAAQDDREGVFNAYLVSAGYQFAGDYATGVEITQYNQVVRDSSGEFWRLSGSTELPYTTTGSGLPEGGAFVAVGDAVLRQDLANPDKGSAMVARGVVAVDSIADLLALPEGQRKESLRYLVKGYATGSPENGGGFYWTNADISTDVSSDPEGGYYIAPSDAPTGADGGWVRFLGTFSSINFPQSAPPGASFYSKTLGRVYFRFSGEWEPVDAYLLGLLDAHVQTKDAHGLQDSQLAIGQGAEALGTFPLAIGKDVQADSSYSVGRSITNNSYNSCLFGRNISVTVSDQSTQNSNVVIGNSCTLTDSARLTVIGYSITAAGTNGVAIGLGVNATGWSYIGIGNSAEVGPEAIAIGSGTTATHARSAAIGFQAETTDVDQIVLGGSAHTVFIPGNLEVTGTKNFSIPHPDPSKSSTHKLLHTSYEGPTRGGTIYRFRVSVENNSADIALPDYYEHLNEGGDVFVNAVGHFGVGYGEVSGNSLTIHASSPGEYVVMVMAERKDPAAVAGWKGVEVQI